MQRRALSVWPAAQADVTRLGEDNPELERRALALIKLIEDGRVSGQPLELMPKYGDLADCRKVYFSAAPGGPPTHRIVYQVVGEGAGVEVIEVVEVVAVEARAEGYAYLLTAHRLGRLPAETVPESRRVHESVIKRRGEQRRAKRTSRDA